MSNGLYSTLEGRAHESPIENTTSILIGIVRLISSRLVGFLTHGFWNSWICTCPSLVHVWKFSQDVAYMSIYASSHFLMWKTVGLKMRLPCSISIRIFIQGGSWSIAAITRTITRGNLFVFLWFFVSRASSSPTIYFEANLSSGTRNHWNHMQKSLLLHGLLFGLLLVFKRK